VLAWTNEQRNSAHNVQTVTTAQAEVPINCRSQPYRTVARILTLSALVVVLSYASPVASQESRTAIASGRAKDFFIELTNKNGRLRAGENHLCITFQKTETGTLVDVGNVAAEFSLLVGKIEENPIVAHLSLKGAGEYCGEIDLGRQYYSPSSYYVFVRYIDPTGSKRKKRIFVAVK
jgi:hypothetical protein